MDVAISKHVCFHVCGRDGNLRTENCRTRLSYLSGALETHLISLFAAIIGEGTV